MLLGIDFGTTRTVVAAARAGRYPTLTFDVRGELRRYIPGLALWRGGALEFGWDAAAGLAEMDDTVGSRRSESVGASVFVRSIKRAVSGLAPDESVPGLPDSITALDLAAGFLAHVREMVTTCSNLELPGADELAEPLPAAVAVPANAGTRQRYLTLEAFARAGFSVEKMLNEPTAAAIEFAHRNSGVLEKRSPKRYVVVYDLGGGTFDTSAVSLQGSRFELLSSEGIGALGGDDFDEVILAIALAQVGLSAQSIAPGSRSALLETCREAKESLRPNTRRLLVDFADRRGHLPGPGGDESAAGDEPIVLDTKEIYRQCQPIIDRTLALVEGVFARLGEHDIDPDNPRQLGGLYLVGGSVAFPLVGRALRAKYKRKIQLAPEPHAATAVGLAISLDPEAGILVKEATTRHFGVWREADGGREKVFDTVLSKDTLPDGDQPLVIERTYRPSHLVGHLRFLECSSLTRDGQPAGDLTPWREVLFPYTAEVAEGADLRDREALAALASERRGPTSDEITETYIYDPSGQIQVAIANRTRGYQKTYVLGTLR